MKNKYFIIALLFIFLALIACQFKAEKASSKEINTEEFKRFIKDKPYTILYFWVSWCGYSQAGLVNDYSKNYKYINNDTVQSLLIVASDTNSINSFMNNNNINVPYKCLHEGKHHPIERNFKDGKNMEEFIEDMFVYENKRLGFPTVLLVDSSFTGLMDSDETADAVRILRYFERKKASNSNVK